MSIDGNFFIQLLEVSTCLLFDPDYVIRQNYIGIMHMNLLCKFQEFLQFFQLEEILKKIFLPDISNTFQ